MNKKEYKAARRAHIAMVARTQGQWIWSAFGVKPATRKERDSLFQAALEVHDRAQRTGRL
jgi:hypothetical protein